MTLFYYGAEFRKVFFSIQGVFVFFEFRGRSLIILSFGL